jgi:ABC-type taurine transport system substrate-binding protein
MVFLDILRSKFQIKSSVINQEDILRISRLSGVAIEKINELITNIQYIYSLEILSEKELISFNKRLEEFYKYNLR